MRARPLASALLSSAIGCEALELAPIELDVSSNCAAAEVVVTVGGVQSPARPWQAVAAATADRPGTPSAWLLVVRSADDGSDQLALLHVDDQLAIDQEVIVGAPAGLAEQFAFVDSGIPGVAWLTQWAPGTFYVWKYDAAQTPPLVAASPNLAAVPVPCDLDSDGTFESCAASDWFQALVFFHGAPYALTFPPKSDTFAMEVTPTPLDQYLSPMFPLDPGRTIVFAAQCNDDLSPSDYEACQALLGERSYPRLSSIGLRRDLPRGYTMLAMYREVRQGDQQATTADVPLFLFRPNDTLNPSGSVQVDAELPSPRDAPPYGLAVDANATYLHYTASDGAAVLVRATRAPTKQERLDRQFDFPEGASLLQLEDDIGLHRIVEGQWEILKLFPDAPERSETARFEADAPITAIEEAGPGTFLVRRDDGVADLVHVRCAVPMSE